MTVPHRLQQQGFTPAAAEQIFVAEAARVGTVISIEPNPSVQVSSRPTLMAALAKPLNLDGVVAAVQTRFGRDVVIVVGTISSEEHTDRLDMTLVVTSCNQPPFQLTLTRQDGGVVRIVRDAATATVEFVAPYRAAALAFMEGLAGKAEQIDRARAIGGRSLAQPVSYGSITNHALLHNLMAMIAMVQSDEPRAIYHLDVADGMTTAESSARYVIQLNKTMVALSRRQPEEAARDYEDGRELVRHGYVPPFIPHVARTVGALVAWGKGDLDDAENRLRNLIRQEPDDIAPRTYLARLLEARGDQAGAAAERQNLSRTWAIDRNLPTSLTTIFWVDPVNGGLTRR